MYAVCAMYVTRAVRTAGTTRAMFAVHTADMAQTADVDIVVMNVIHWGDTAMVHAVDIIVTGNTTVVAEITRIAAVDVIMDITSI